MANTCRASDDYTHQLGDPNETMVKVALDFLAGRGCTAISGVTTQAVAERGLLTRAQPRKTTDLELPGAY